MCFLDYDTHFSKSCKHDSRLLAKTLISSNPTPSLSEQAAYYRAHFSIAVGSLSITYLPRATLTIGTPGTFLTLLFKSLSFVATK